MRKSLAVCALVLCVLAVTAAGCATSTSSTIPTAIPVGAPYLTPGMSKAYIVPGKTTQAEVMELFGPPDLMTRKEGGEVWTYDKVSQEVTKSEGYLTILIAGKSSESRSSSTKTIMLIVYFDANDVVTDYKLSASRF